MHPNPSAIGPVADAASDPTRRRLLLAGVLAALAAGAASANAAEASPAHPAPPPHAPDDPGLGLDRPVIGLMVYPGMFLQDVIGPLTVFQNLMAKDIHLLWKEPGPIEGTSERGVPLVTVHATTGFNECPEHLDVLMIPGGVEGTFAAMVDPDVLDFLERQAPRTRFLTSVCTGSLVLGAAGLLRGRKATTHWAYHDMLAPLGAIPVQERVVRDGNLFTGGGITAGIDFALVLAAELYSEAAAQLVQLQIEYAPAPPFDSGRPDTAPAHVREEANKRTAESRRVRGEIVARAAARLG